MTSLFEDLSQSNIVSEIKLPFIGWMLYYAAAIGMLGALDSTPIRSMVSKMVEPTEFGKLFTFLSTAQGM